MAGVLIFSPQCNHCQEIIHFIQQNKTLASMVKYHNVNTQGIPEKYKTHITRVPTMLTNDSKILVGKEIKSWLSSLLPSNVEQHSLGCSFGTCSLDNTDEDSGDMFALDNYGQSLSPVMTPELQAKINKKVQDAYDSFKD